MRPVMMVMHVRSIAVVRPVSASSISITSVPAAEAIVESIAHCMRSFPGTLSLIPVCSVPFLRHSQSISFFPFSASSTVPFVIRDVLNVIWEGKETELVHPFAHTSNEDSRKSLFLQIVKFDLIP